jgi:hypothetical protein
MATHHGRGNSSEKTSGLRNSACQLGHVYFLFPRRLAHLFISGNGHCKRRDAQLTVSRECGLADLLRAPNVELYRFAYCGDWNRTLTVRVQVSSGLPVCSQQKLTRIERLSDYQSSDTYKDSVKSSVCSSSRRYDVISTHLRLCLPKSRFWDQADPTLWLVFEVSSIQLL